MAGPATKEVKPPKETFWFLTPGQATKEVMPPKETSLILTENPQTKAKARKEGAQAEVFNERNQMPLGAPAEAKANEDQPPSERELPGGVEVFDSTADSPEAEEKEVKAQEEEKAPLAGWIVCRGFSPKLEVFATEKELAEGTRYQLQCEMYKRNLKKRRH